MPETAIPAQEGIPTSAFQQYLKASVNPNFHIPDRAETTVFDIKTYGSSCPPSASCNDPYTRLWVKIRKTDKILIP
ncbi:hypothetical protein [Neisseria cinerea]|uniref:Uncharacterized protein n=1 Tax=Neisseria cinerea ATCC 14685 TaxID=546262 RepID=D0W5T6_NEICI|nr:hypothetical protein [Neisseria cinerea]EEZ70810.1 hypothetical protein NEICINOT_05056 [Neisseria cinerea ATCC 14685]MCD2070976.1 hypothetical protein [Neisseria cinerea]